MKKRDKVKHFFVGGRHFKSEFKRQVRALILITLGFTIAFSWRQTIFDIIQTAVQSLMPITGISSSIITSVAITIIALAIIYAASALLKDQKDD
ncbi:MAG: hypothetical protein ABIH92_04375 [Nanoarchaeota archaeon]